MTAQIDPETGTVTGYIPDGPQPASVYPQPASLYLPDLEIRERLRVVLYGDTVVVHLSAGLAVHLHTAAQAREFIRAFALAHTMTPDFPGPVAPADSSTELADRAGEPAEVAT